MRKEGVVECPGIIINCAADIKEDPLELEINSARFTEGL